MVLKRGILGELSTYVSNAKIRRKLLVYVIGSTLIL
jgi:hypothetical protein